MIASEDLFTLIKSLTKSEKKYFKQHTALYTRAGGNTYLLLFSAIHAQKKYDEKELLEQFKEQAFTKQFSVAKNFLYNRVLASLEAYHNSIYADVRSLIHRVEILIEKGLYHQSQKLIRKAKKIASQHEMHSYLLELSHYWESHIAVKQFDPKTQIKILEEGKKHLVRFGNEIEYASLSARFVAHYFEYGKTKNRHHLNKMDALIKNPFLQDESMAVTFRSKMRFHEAHLFHNSAQSNDNGTYASLLKLTSLFDTHPEKIKQYSANYMLNLYNLVEACIALKKYHLVPGYLEKLKSTSESLTNKFLKERHFVLYTSSSFLFYHTTGQFEKAKKEIERTEYELQAYEKKLPDIEKAMIWFHIAFYYFGTGHFAKCLSWLNKIRNELSLDLLPDFQTEVKIFYLVVHYEMGNTELIPDLVQSLFRFLIKKERLQGFEKLILSFLKKLPYVEGDQNLIPAYKELKKQIDALPHKVTHSHFDLVSWIESKIENRTFAGIILEKAGNK